MKVRSTWSSAGLCVAALVAGFTATGEAYANGWLQTFGVVGQHVPCCARPAMPTVVPTPQYHVVSPAPTFYSTPAAQAATQRLLATTPAPLPRYEPVGPGPYFQNPSSITQPVIPQTMPHMVAAPSQPSIPAITSFQTAPTEAVAKQPSISATAPFYSGTSSINAVQSSPSTSLTLNSDLSQVVTMKPGAYSGTPSIDAK